MSTKRPDGRFSYRSLFMVVRVQAGPVKLFIPLSLFVIDQTLAALQELASVVEHLVPGLNRRISAAISMSGYVSSKHTFSESISLCRELINELRRYGKWRMVEVKTHDETGQKTIVYVDFI